MSNKTIAFLLPSLSAGGIGGNTLRLASSFLKKGYKVDLVLIRARGEYISQVPNGVNIVDLKCKRVGTSLFKIKKYLNSVSPGVLISANDYLNVFAIGAKFLSKAEFKLIVTIQTHLSTQIANYNNFKTKIIMFLAKKLYRYADRIVCVSYGVAKDAEATLRIPMNKIDVVYNPIVNDEIFIEQNKDMKHKWLDSSKDFVVISVGRLTKQKDFPTLIKAFNSLTKNKNNVKLIILGDGEEKNNLKTLINHYQLENIIELAGFQNNPYKYIKKADLFVMSSQWEGFGNVIVEALATNTPVISTNCFSGPSEILDNGRYGSLIPVGDHRALKNEIEEIIEGKKNYSYLVERAQEFSVEKAVNNYEKLF